jgi:carboxymethylenebutenolidase
VIYQGQLSETITTRGADGDNIESYYARPLGPGPFPGVVVIHYGPGLDEWNRELARKFAHHGYAAIAPNFYSRYEAQSPEEQGALARAQAGVSDDQAIADVAGAADFLRAQPYSNGKLGVIGCCSGGRHTFLVACKLPFDAAVDCWGGSVMAETAELTAARPVAPIDYAPSLSCPLLGLFGNEDTNPDPVQVNRTEETLAQNGKDFEFHRYDGAGHGFMITIRAAYRQEQASDAWEKIWSFFGKHLASPVPELALR